MDNAAVFLIVINPLIYQTYKTALLFPRKLIPHRSRKRRHRLPQVWRRPDVFGLYADPFVLIRVDAVPSLPFLRKRLFDNVNVPAGDALVNQ